MKNAIVGLFFALVATQAQAQTVVGPGTVTYVENGWYGEGIAIHTDASIVAPAGCTAPTNEFAVLSTHAAYKQVVAMLLSAYYTKAKLQLVVTPGACTFGNRTTILSVRLMQ